MQATVIDGYNLLFREVEPGPSISLQELREDFLRRIDAVRTPGQRVVVVFDGTQQPRRRGGGHEGVRVLYSRTPRSADDLIVSLVERAPRRAITVLTHDRNLMQRVKSAGGDVGDPEAFLRGPQRSRPQRAPEKPSPPSGRELDEWEALFEEREGEDPGPR